jgi:hypothetical protein
MDFWLLTLVSSRVTGALLLGWRGALDFETALLAIADVAQIF